jgi:hypothetical protein
MTDTNDLIDSLVTQSQPVHRLPSPGWQASFWLCLAFGILALLAIEHGIRPDLADQLRHRDFTISLVASLLTGLLAAIACMTASLPDRSRWWLLLPVPTLLLWLSGVGHGCLTDWVEYDAGAVAPGESLRCFSTLLLVSLPLSALMFLLLRHAARLRPLPVTLMAGLAVAALTSTAMSLLHQLDATLMVLIWNIGASLAIVVIEAALGRRVMAWFGDRLAR